MGVQISGENNRQFGLAHGFVVISETAFFSYKCSEYYLPKDEHAILWNGPDIGIEWSISEGIQLSQKDLVGIKLCNFDRSNLPVFGGQKFG